MTTVVDVWRAVDTEAWLVSGDPEALRAPVRGLLRSRAAPPHLPTSADGELLVIDSAVLGGQSLEGLFDTLREAELRPSAVMVAGIRSDAVIERSDERMPVLASADPIGRVADRSLAYLEGESAMLERTGLELRLAAAEAALADPVVSAPAGIVAARIRRGLAIAAEGELRSLHPRPAGRALAARFAAAFNRLLAGGGSRTDAVRRTRDGLWLAEHRIRPGASVWLFDDLPFARIDLVAAEALGFTLRALLRRPSTPATPPPAPDSGSPPVAPALRPVGDQSDPVLATLLAVARANGRVAPAARALGVHRNTVLYRLRAGKARHGLDPRRPDDALRLLREHGGDGGGDGRR